MRFHRLTVRLNDVEVETVDRIARVAKFTRSEAVRFAILFTKLVLEDRLPDEGFEEKIAKALMSARYGSYGFVE